MLSQPEFSAVGAGVDSLDDVLSAAAADVRVLLLHGNRVGTTRLNPLTRPRPKITQLVLSSNTLNDVECAPLAAVFPNLALLDVAANRIAAVTGLPQLTHLRSLNAAFNRLRDLCMLEPGPGSRDVSCKLETLDLRDNQISELSAITSLLRCGALRDLKLQSVTVGPNGRVSHRHANPVCRLPGYTARVLAACPSLQLLDGLPVGTWRDWLARGYMEEGWPAAVAQTAVAAESIPPSRTVAPGRPVPPSTGYGSPTPSIDRAARRFFERHGYTAAGVATSAPAPSAAAADATAHPNTTSLSATPLPAATGDAATNTVVGASGRAITMAPATGEPLPYPHRMRGHAHSNTRVDRITQRAAAAAVAAITSASLLGSRQLRRRSRSRRRHRRSSSSAGSSSCSTSQTSASSYSSSAGSSADSDTSSSGSDSASLESSKDGAGKAGKATAATLAIASDAATALGVVADGTHTAPTADSTRARALQSRHTQQSNVPPAPSRSQAVRPAVGENSAAAGSGLGVRGVALRGAKRAADAAAAAAILPAHTAPPRAPARSSITSPAAVPPPVGPIYASASDSGAHRAAVQTADTGGSSEEQPPHSSCAPVSPPQQQLLPAQSLSAPQAEHAPLAHAAAAAAAGDRGTRSRLAHRSHGDHDDERHHHRHSRTHAADHDDGIDDGRRRQRGSHRHRHYHEIESELPLAQSRSRSQSHRHGSSAPPSRS